MKKKNKGFGYISDSGLINKHLGNTFKRGLFSGLIWGVAGVSMMMSLLNSYVLDLSFLETYFWTFLIVADSILLPCSLHYTRMSAKTANEIDKRGLGYDVMLEKKRRKEKSKQKKGQKLEEQPIIEKVVINKNKEKQTTSPNIVVEADKVGEYIVDISDQISNNSEEMKS